MDILLCTMPTLCTPVRVQHRLSFRIQIVQQQQQQQQNNNNKILLTLEIQEITLVSPRK